MKYQKKKTCQKIHQTKQLNLKQKKYVEKNDESRGTYNSNSQIKFKNSMLRSSLCDYSDAYILVKGTMIVAEVVAGRENNGI